MNQVIPIWSSMTNQTKPPQASLELTFQMRLKTKQTTMILWLHMIKHPHS